jgi:hypothetical protein
MAAKLSLADYDLLDDLNRRGGTASSVSDNAMAPTAWWLPGTPRPETSTSASSNTR